MLCGINIYNFHGQWRMGAIRKGPQSIREYELIAVCIETSPLVQLLLLFSVLPPKYQNGTGNCPR